jgi:hypothetical protein
MIHHTIDSIFVNTCRSHRSEWKWYTAGSLHFHSQGPQDRKSAALTLRNCVVIWKCATANLLLFKNCKGNQHFENVKVYGDATQTSHLYTGIIKILSLSRETIPLNKKNLKVFFCSVRGPWVPVVDRRKNYKNYNIVKLSLDLIH